MGPRRLRELETARWVLARATRGLRLIPSLVLGLSVVAGPGHEAFAVVSSAMTHAVAQHTSPASLWSTCAGVSSPPRIARPEALAVNGAGRVFVANDGTRQVLVLSSSGRVLRCLPLPIHADNIAVDGRGNVFAASSASNRVVKIGLRGRVLYSIGGRGSGPGRFRTIGDIAVTWGGRLFVADDKGRRIQSFSPEGHLLTVWSTRPRGAHLHPNTVAVQHGRVYVGFYSDNSPVGGSIAAYGKSGKLLARRWSGVSPDKIAAGQRGDLWVVSEVLCAGCVQGNLTRFSPSGKQVQSWKFINPPLAVDDRNRMDVRVYQAEAKNNRIVVRRPNGRKLAVWK